MRWEALFEDLQAQWEAQALRMLEGEIAERARIDQGSVTLQARLIASRGLRVRVRQVDGESVEGSIGFSGDGWVAINEGNKEILLVLAACQVFSGLDRFAAVADRTSASRLSITSGLRGLSRDRALVSVVVHSGARTEQVHGLLERVGADFIDVAPVPTGEVRRQNAGPSVTVPLGALVRVSSLR